MSQYTKNMPGRLLTSSKRESPPSRTTRRARNAPKRAVHAHTMPVIRACLGACGEDTKDVIAVLAKARLPNRS